jgi:hypothetical protein
MSAYASSQELQLPGSLPSNDDIIKDLAPSDTHIALDRGAYLLALTPLLGVQLPSGGGGPAVPNPMSWIAATRSYLALARQWPSLDRNTKLTYIGDLGATGKRIQALVSGVAKGHSSSALFSRLITDYQASLTTLGSVLDQARQDLIDDGPGQPEAQQVLTISPSPSAVLSRSVGQLRIPFAAKSFPPEWRIAFRVGADWRATYILTDALGKYLGSHTLGGIPGIVVPDPAGYLELQIELAVGNNTIFSGVYRSENDTIPQNYNCGGVAGCTNPYLQTIFDRQWPNLRNKIEQGLYSAPKEGEQDYSGLAACRRELQSAINERIYANVAKSSVDVLRPLEARKLLLQNYAELAFASEINNNDAFMAVLRGSVQILGKDGLTQSFNAVDPDLWLKSARDRVDLLRQLVVAASTAREQQPLLLADPLLDSMLRQLTDYYDEQRSLCATGRKPRQDCAPHPSFP